MRLLLTDESFIEDVDEAPFTIDYGTGLIQFTANGGEVHSITITDVRGLYDSEGNPLFTFAHDAETYA